MSDTITKWNEMEEDRKRSLYPGDVVITETTKVWDPDYKGFIVEPSKKEEAIKNDRYVQQIKEKFEHRSQVGIKKYGTTLERDDLGIQDWLTHFEEELMDGLLYLQVLKDKLK